MDTNGGQLSYTDLAKILEENGWKEVEGETKDGRRFYEIVTHPLEIPVRALLSDSGILGLRVHASSSTMDDYFYRGDLNAMQGALLGAEDILLAIGVPFCKGTYFRGYGAKQKASRNRELREKYGLLARK